MNALGERMQAVYEKQNRRLDEDIPEIRERNPRRADIIEGQRQLRDRSLRCTASEAHILPTVAQDQEAFGHAGRYGAYDEGEADKKYYEGGEFASAAEKEAKENVQALLEKIAPGNDFTVNVQPLSGANANLAVYHGVLKPGDPVMGIKLDHGGHLSHFSGVSITGEIYDAEHYEVTESGELDYEAIDQMMAAHKPRMIVVGGSALPKNIDYKKFRELCDKHGVMLHADISHTAAHQLTGMLESDVFEYADTIAFTTHKMGGPKGAILLTRKDVLAMKYMDPEKLAHAFRKPDTAKLTAAIRKGVFPGLQGGPNSTNYTGIAALFDALGDEVMTGWSERVLGNIQDVQGRLLASGVQLIAPSDTHLILMDAEASSDSDGKSGAGKRLATALSDSGIILNANGTRVDKNSPMRPGGLRIGMNGPARRKGWSTETNHTFADIVSRLARELNDSATLEVAVSESRATVDGIIENHPIRWDF